MKEKPIIIQTASGKSHRFHSCKHCGSELIASVGQSNPHCFYCGEIMGKGSKISDKVALKATANIDEDAELIKCSSCEEVMKVAETDSTAEEMSASSYCVFCGSQDLEAVDSDLEASDSDNKDEDDFTASNGDEEDFEDLESASQKMQEQTEKDVQEALEGEASDLNGEGEEDLDAGCKKEIKAEDLQWSAVEDEENGENGTLIASSSKTGLPVFVFHKNTAPKGMQPLFASTSFVNAFLQTAETKSLPDAVKSFGGKVLQANALSPVEMERMALNRLQATAMPKFVECCQMAVEGGTKGLYNDVHASITECLISELIAASIPRDRAERAVNNAFALHGSSLFGTLIAKAMDLYNKPEAQRLEAKAMITGASGPTFQAYDQAQLEVQAALHKQELSLVPPITLSASHRGNGDTAQAIRAKQKQLFGKR